MTASADRKAIASLAKKIERAAAGHGEPAFHPPLATEALARVEAAIGAPLPEPYRAFVVEVATGETRVAGALDFVLLGPEQAIAEIDGGRPGAPFPCASEGPFDGALPIGDRGCGEYDCLVLAGPEAGAMWHRSERGWAPCAPEKRGKVAKGAKPARVDFLSWITPHIDAIAKAAPPPILPSSKEVRIARPLAAIPAAVLEAKGLEKLDLYGCGLRELPDGLRELRALRLLDLTENPLARLPAWIGELAALEDLRLWKSAIEALPEEIGALSRLRALSLSGPIAELPRAFGALGALERLDARLTRIASLPEAFGDLASLRELDLSGLPIARLPERFGELRLRKLTLADMPALDFAHALPVIGRIASLEELWLSAPAGTRAAKPPPARALFGLTKLRSAQLHRLGLAEIPEGISALQELQWLIVHGSAITRIPDEVARMPKLKSISLLENPIAAEELARARARAPGVKLAP